MLLVLLDLVGFKEYNDTYSHPAGDALLKRLASKLSRVVITRGSAYRLDGDEFAAVLSIVDDAGQLADLSQSGQGEVPGTRAGRLVGEEPIVHQPELALVRRAPRRVRGVA